MIKPTARQMLVLCAIDASVRTLGYPPTRREIGAVLGISSTNAVQDHLLALMRKGLVLMGGDGLSRATTLTAAGRAMLPPAPRPDATPFAAEQAIEALDLSA